MKCPLCMSDETKVYTSRPKDFNNVGKEFRIDDIPESVKILDYRLRRHKCKKCGYCFATVETYFNYEDVMIYKENSKENSQKLQVL